MGLKQLEWHEGNRGMWTARVAYGNQKYRRFADVNSFAWIGYTAINKHKGKVPVVFSPVQYGVDPTWHDSIEAAKLHVEAIFALDND